MRPAVTFLAAAALVTVAQPAVAKRPTPALAAVTTITATTSGYLDVLVPRDARLSPAATRNPDVRISGSGRFVGLWLTRYQEGVDYSGLTAYRLPTFAGGGTTVQGSTTPGPQCTNLPHDTLPLHTDCKYPKADAILLKAGRYRLTVVTDNAPVTIQLKLRGLSARRAALRPAYSLHTVQQPLPQRETAGDRMVTFGDVLGLGGATDLYVIARAERSVAPAVREESLCVRSASEASRPFAYAPPCAGGYSGFSHYTVEAGGQRHDWWSGHASSGSFDDSNFAVGGSFSDSGGVRLRGALAVAIEMR